MVSIKIKFNQIRQLLDNAYITEDNSSNGTDNSSKVNVDHSEKNSTHSMIKKLNTVYVSLASIDVDKCSSTSTGTMHLDISTENSNKNKSICQTVYTEIFLTQMHMQDVISLANNIRCRCQ